MPDAAVLSIRNVSKTFGQRRALDGVSLDARKGEMIALIGPSGSGKSTLMNLIGCLDTPTQGQYFINGRLVSEMNDDELAYIRNREIGFVFQTFNLLARATALHNVELPLIYNGTPAQERIERAKAALRMVELEQRMTHKPNELSGGQRQRVAIARALVHDPMNVLLDEPTNGLDVMSTRAVREIIRRLRAEGRTVIFSSHVMQEVSALCDTIVVLGHGRVAAAGTPDALREQTGHQNLEDAFVALVGLEREPVE